MTGYQVGQAQPGGHDTVKGIVAYRFADAIINAPIPDIIETVN